MLSMLLYLNGQKEGVEGGDTFADGGREGRREGEPGCRDVDGHYSSGMVSILSVLRAGDVLGEGTRSM